MGIQSYALPSNWSWQVLKFSILTMWFSVFFLTFWIYFIVVGFFVAFLTLFFSRYRYRWYTLSRVCSFFCLVGGARWTVPNLITTWTQSLDLFLPTGLLPKHGSQLHRRRILMAGSIPLTSMPCLGSTNLSREVRCSIFFLVLLLVDKLIFFWSVLALLMLMCSDRSSTHVGSRSLCSVRCQWY